MLLRSVANIREICHNDDMNYLAHAIRFLDRPEFVAGTATPDWLSVADRKVRLRPKHLSPWLNDADLALAEFAAGVQQHHDDDGWFHTTRGFAEVTAILGKMFREAVGPGDNFRCGFLGHIVTEMLIDAVLIDDNADLLHDYYGVMAEVDPQFVQNSVNRMSAKPTENLAEFVELFQRERILVDYQDSRRLWFRLNQVLRRVKLTPLPEESVRVLDAGRSLIRDRWDDLLPTDRFSFGSTHTTMLAKDSLP
jgi:hypothetical protein